MTENIVFSAPHGLHGLPGAQLVKLVKTLDGKVFLSTVKREVDASSMLGLMSLGLKSGMELTVRTEGGDEQGNMTCILEFLNNITE